MRKSAARTEQEQPGLRSPVQGETGGQDRGPEIRSPVNDATGGQDREPELRWSWGKGAVAQITEPEHRWSWGERKVEDRDTELELRSNLLEDPDSGTWVGSQDWTQNIKYFHK